MYNPQSTKEEFPKTFPEEMPKTFPKEMPEEYEIYQKIGKGSFGSVYKASKDDKIIALKVVATKSLEEVDSIEREIEVLQSLSCLPSLVCYYNSKKIGSTFYIEMEYIQGENLRSFAKQYQTNKNFSRYIMDIMSDLMSGINYLHRHNLIHRDIKPENIMIKYPELQPKLIDFGLACLSKRMQICLNNYPNRKSGQDRSIGTINYPNRKSGQDRSSDMLNQNCCLGNSGTPYFMAPETLLKGLAYPKSDIWSLAASVYTVVTGTTVFTPKPENIIELKRLAAASPDLVTTGNLYLDELLEMMLEKNVVTRMSGENVVRYLSSHKPNLL